MKKKILITGVAGFIGSNLASMLCAQGYRVVGVDNLSFGLRSQVPDGVEFHKVDIRSKKFFSLCKGIDTIFHLAAKNCISDCQQDPLGTADSNIFGTINVFEAARTVRIRKVIYAETSAIYEGSSLFPTPESEEKPVSFYACSKLAASLFARSYIRLYGMNLTGLRYFNVYGPRQDYRRSIPPVFSAFMISLLKKRKPVIYGDGKKRRDFVYVDDVNNFHLLAMQDDRTNGNIYNIGSGKNFSIQEMYDLICSLVGVKVRPRYAQDLPGEAQITLADISLARSLGWEPKVDLAAGLKETLNFIKTHVMRKL